MTDENADPVVVAALYHFTRLSAPEALQTRLKAFCAEHSIFGTLLLAGEGINGTVAGSRQAIDALLAFLRAMPEFDVIEHKESLAPSMPFLRMKVRLKDEIVTMGVPDIDPTQIVGTYVEPEDWNALLADENTVLVDTRNDYEVRIGTFRSAIDPQTSSFREFPDWVRRNENRLKGKKIAMFCTGGIRCEKATAFVKALGHEQVFHLKGGILKYLETVAPEQSVWDGACFVFDERVSVGHGLEPGPHTLCRACGAPLEPEDRAHQAYREGVSCPFCIDAFDETDRARFAERQKQITLARQRGRGHLGPAANMCDE